MSQTERQPDLQEKARLLLQGSLKHARVAALAASLVPVAAVPAAASTDVLCSSGGMICGIVWNDINGNGVQDAGEPGIENAVVSLDGTVVSTGPDGFYEFNAPDGTYQIVVQIPPGTQTSPSNAGSNDALDSDGIPDGIGNSIATVTNTPGGMVSTTDFGFFTTPVEQPGTGTPGYWLNHPEAWPVASITVGGVVYTKAQALAWLAANGKDKTATMFSSLVPAKLNVLIGNDGSCISSTIDSADAWMATYGPVGSKVAASSAAWKIGEPLHRRMDNYNNGMLCAPHRD